MNHAASDLMRRTIFAGAVLGVLFFQASCAKQAPGPHATILMRDGTTLSGTVTATSPAEVTLTGDDNTAHTVPMTQVKSIEYDDAAAAPAGGGQTGATANRRASEAAHEHHYHPTQAEIHTQTYVLAAGTKVSVRTEDAINSASAVEGQTYAAEVTDDVLDANGDVVVPHGSNAQIVIRSASKGGRFRGASDLVLDLQSISVEGQQYTVSTNDLKERRGDRSRSWRRRWRLDADPDQGRLDQSAGGNRADLPTRQAGENRRGKVGLLYWLFPVKEAMKVCGPFCCQRSDLWTPETGVCSCPLFAHSDR
jgi:hypothetical protein